MSVEESSNLIEIQCMHHTVHSDDRLGGKQIRLVPPNDITQGDTQVRVMYSFFKMLQ